VDEELITLAKKANINLSSFLEIRISDYLNNNEICYRRGGFLLTPVEADKLDPILPIIL